MRRRKRRSFGEEEEEEQQQQRGGLVSKGMSIGGIDDDDFGENRGTKPVPDE